MTQQMQPSLLLARQHDKALILNQGHEGNLGSISRKYQSRVEKKSILTINVNVKVSDTQTNSGRVAERSFCGSEINSRREATELMQKIESLNSLQQNKQLR